jgi:TRAP-type transport system periplasmic protein
MKTIVGRFGAIVLGILAVWSLTASASAQTYTMKMSLVTINDVTHEFYKTWKAGIDARSGGRLKVEIYPANQLGQIPAVIEGVALGTIEVGSAASGFFVSLEPRFQVMDGIGMFDDIQHSNRVFTDPEIRARLATWGADKGVEVLAPGTYGPMMVLAHKPVRGVADFQDQKIRTPGGAAIQVEPFRKLGVQPVSIPLGEVLPAMQNHTIDGLMTALAVYVNFKYADIAKVTTFLPGTFIFVPVVANRQFLQKIGPELAAIVREEALKAQSVYTGWNMADLKRVEDAWRKAGGELVTMPAGDVKRYLDTTAPVTQQILSSNSKVKEDYDALLAAAKKHRQ